MRLKRKTVISLAACASLAFVPVIVSSCSADDEYEKFAGDELFTYANCTRVSGVEGQLEPSLYCPSVIELSRNPEVIAKMEEAWQMTLNNTLPNSRKEFGFYIYYDKITHSYSFTNPFIEGVLVDSTHKASINWPQIADSSQVCAFFHTHTSYEYLPANYNRYTGPSQTDRTGNLPSWIPGLLYDYESQILSGGMPRTCPKKLYTYGVERRIN